jgi:FkbM family methyltransferase
MRLKTVLRRLLPNPVEIRLQALDHYFRGEREIRLLKNLVPRDRVAVDVGANMGTYTFFLDRLAASTVAFEPNPQLASRLRAVFSRVDVRAKAVSDVSRTTTLRIPIVGDRDAHERASVAVDFGEATPVRTIEVTAVPLDGEGLVDVGFLKIDAEQHELAVLRGAARLIGRDRPVILTEATPLRYADGLVQTFGGLLDDGYCGWFWFQGRYLPFSEYRSDVHANRETFPRVFMGTNVIFAPLGSRAQAWLESLG